MVGLATDGANNMSGISNSVTSRFKHEIPHLFSLKCVCHSFHLCASHACEVLPDSLEKGLRSIYNYVHYSPKRTYELSAYQELWSLKPQKLVHPSITRWLSVIGCVERVLKHFIPLNSYFNVEAKINTVGTALEICKWFEDPLTKLYLNFLNFILPMFTTLNCEMQSEKVRIHVLYERVCLLVKNILSYFVDDKYLNGDNWKTLDCENTKYHVPLKDIYMGGQIKGLLIQNQLSDETMKKFQETCLKFYILAVCQIKKRFPFDSVEVKCLQSFNILNPLHFPENKSIVPLVINFPHIVCDDSLNDIDSEFRTVRQLDIDKSDIMQFWAVVCKMVKGDDSFMFPYLRNFLNHVFCLPHSSAAVERIFSAINLNKTKIRNRLITETMEGILHTKSFVQNTDMTKLEFTKEHFVSFSQYAFDHKN